MKNVVGYVRVSGDEQVKEGMGLEIQEKAIRAYCHEHKLNLLNIFSDPGVSGAVVDRPGLAAMLEAVLGDGIDTVIVHRLDRLARDTLVGLVIRSRLQKAGIGLFSVQEPYLSTEDEDPFVLAMGELLMVFSTLEKKLLVRKLRDSRQYKRAKGADMVEGRRPYGYTTGKDGMLVEIPAEQETIRLMKSLRRKKPGMRRWGYVRIANELNEQGLVARGGGRWWASSVQNVLLRRGGARR